MVTRSFDETNRPPPEPLPEDETQKVFDEEMAKRITPEGVAEVERESADTGGPRRSAIPPRACSFRTASGGRPLRRTSAAAGDGHARLCSRALPATVGAILKLRKRVFDRKITGRLGITPNTVLYDHLAKGIKLHPIVAIAPRRGTHIPYARRRRRRRRRRHTTLSIEPRGRARRGAP